MDKEKQTTQTQETQEQETQETKEVTVQAIREELDEMRSNNQKLQDEIKKLKISNQRMALKLEGKPQTDKELFEGFSKYDNNK